MVITEAEAKTKWCPMVRVGNEAGCNRNHIDFPIASGLYTACLGSTCMMWRWQHPGFDHNQIGEPIEPVPAQGYCGLAGKP